MGGGLPRKRGELLLVLVLVLVLVIEGRNSLRGLCPALAPLARRLRGNFQRRRSADIPVRSNVRPRYRSRIVGRRPTSCVAADRNVRAPFRLRLRRTVLLLFFPD